jgi:3-phenylpropionate/cinnamic acid dioxygenase small subunit
MRTSRAGIITGNAWVSNVVSDAALSSIHVLQVKYLRALDRRDLKAWIDCFARDVGSYVCLTRETVDQDLSIALMMDDCPARLHDRVKIINEIWGGTFEDYLTRHFVQLIDCEEVGSARYRLSSNFMVAYTTMRQETEMLAVGTYEDEIALDPPGPRLLSRKAIVDGAVTPRYLVYPI